MDTVKARLQTQSWAALAPGEGGTPQPQYRNFADGLRQMWRLEGLRGLYRGFGPTVLGSMPASCLYFTTYEFARARLASASSLNASSAGSDSEGSGRSGAEAEAPFFVNFASGVVAETVSCVLWVPVDVVKERMQIQRLPRASQPAHLKARLGAGFYSSGLDAVRSIVRTEGAVGLYRGYGATVLSFGPFSALYFTFYEEFKKALRKAQPKVQAQPRNGKLFEQAELAELPFAGFLACGAAAGACASLFTNPLDIVKLRLQVQRQHRHSGAATLAAPVPVAVAEHKGAQAHMYRNMWDGLRKLYRHEGPRGMMRGVGARMAFHAPATAVNMALFETLKTYTYTHF